MRGKQNLKEKMSTNNHSFYALDYDLVMVIHGRRKVIDSEIGDLLTYIFGYIGPDYHIELKEWRSSEEYIRVRFKAQPDSEIAKFVNAYKSASSRLVKKQFPAISERLCDGCFWERTFMLTTKEGSCEDMLEDLLCTVEEE